MKRIIIVALSLLCIFVIAGCQQALSIQDTVVKAYKGKTLQFTYVHDWSEPKKPGVWERIAKHQAKLEEKKAAEQQAQEEVYYEEYYEPYYGGYDYSYSSNGDGFMQAGVRDGVNGTTETWYSSNSAYHYRTGEWTADENGYYRDSDGYYVVASEDHAEGEVIETSVGQARVYDGGCESGVVDFYVNF